MARVLVTGGASGIGAGTADLLSSEGWDVVRADVAPRDGVIELDISSHDTWLRVMDEIGPLDALVNCAGIRKRAELLDLTPEGWDETVRVNLTGTFFGIQTFAKSLIADNRQGAVVNIASVNAVAPVKGQPHYVASKGGVAMLTKAAALELAQHRIRVNAIAPGSIDTPMQQARLDEPGRRESQLAHIPLGRLGRPADIAHGVSYLLSPRADYITGVILPIDGGYLLA
ncbi:SDR family NAD(P)-dependent oxidoreductase [Arthrobacter sp. MA-N2]|uniref:SDR family NAD(P)-dependent oxidoreductase n=1 Tax=Arthrobacter sp. MA-N2 TaxID=1101188 RepID=UPI0004896A75|nr:SDR family NAD(P)-dependent oxidoreductase [Arthrobacter sp. MA-N2]